LADKNFTVIALAVTLEPGKKEGLLPIKAPLMRLSLMRTYWLLDSIMADLALMRTYWQLDSIMARLSLMRTYWQLDSIMADLALAVQGQDCLYKCIQALNLLGISWPSVMEYLKKDMVHQTHQRIW